MFRSLRKEPLSDIIKNATNYIIRKERKPEDSSTQEAPYSKFLKSELAENILLAESFATNNSELPKQASIGIVYLIQSELPNKYAIDKLEKKIKRNENISLHFLSFKSKFKSSEEVIYFAEYAALIAYLNSLDNNYISLLSEKIILSDYFLERIFARLSETRDFDILYADHDECINNERVNPIFKPSWNPKLILSCNYINHPILINKKFGDKLGWIGSENIENWEYNFIIASLRLQARFEHLSQVLTHINFDSNKDIPLQDNIKFLEDYIISQQLNASINSTKYPSINRIEYAMVNFPLISIIIPFKDKVELLKNCISSIISNTIYPNFEIILVDNNSEKKETQVYLDTLLTEIENLTIIKDHGAFNFSRINNEAVKHSKGEFILFLNNDTQVISKSWLKEMASILSQDEVGVVGSLLLYEDNSIQHAGVILGLGHVAGHAYRFSQLDENVGLNRIHCMQNYSAVTGACLMTKKSLFMECEGFDEINLKIAYNDVDYCLKVRAKGLEVVYTPYAKLYHFESKSRSFDLNKDQRKRYMTEVNYMREKWPKVIQSDPYYNKNLSRKKEDFSIS